MKTSVLRPLLIVAMLLIGVAATTVIDTNPNGGATCCGPVIPQVEHALEVPPA